jgi:hypothetical protein
LNHSLKAVVPEESMEARPPQRGLKKMKTEKSPVTNQHILNVVSKDTVNEFVWGDVDLNSEDDSKPEIEQSD